MLTVTTHRPRNVDSVRAASILYGDWGTSKAYVIGLAFALVGYSAFWLILAVSILSLLIGVNYIIVCRLYPNGGGVYASVRNRSEVISIIGAFFLIADYLVTAALSGLSAFSYFGVSDPVLYTAIAIGFIGLLNFLGPRHTGTLAFAVVVASVIVLTVLAVLSLPFLKAAWRHIQPLQGDAWAIWKHFVGVIVALSGIEAIANSTGVMRLNRGATLTRPKVNKTSTPAIVFVMIEVVLFTSLFGFVAAAVGDYTFPSGTVDAPGHPNVRDYMLRFLAETFGGSFFGAGFGTVFGILVSAVIGILLLSAVNTAINGLVSIQYIMSSDGELPSLFQKVNRFGVPLVPLLFATAIPILLVITMKDVAKLAALYAIGFVGAIATNLGSTSTDRTLSLKKWERGMMFFSFLIMAAVELTLFWDKPHARYYALAVILAGLGLRTFAKRLKRKKIPSSFPEIKLPAGIERHALLCSSNQVGKALRSAVEKSKKNHCPLHLVFAREQNVITEKDLERAWQKDKEAVQVYEYAQRHGVPSLIEFHYSITDSLPDIIVAYAIQLEVDEIFVDPPEKSSFLKLFHGDLKKKIHKIIPKGITLRFY